MFSAQGEMDSAPPRRLQPRTRRVIKSHGRAAVYPYSFYLFFDQVVEKVELYNFGFRGKNGPNIVFCVSCKISKLLGLSTRNGSRNIFTWS